MSQQTPVIYSGGTAPGSTTMPNIQACINAAYSSHAGNAAPIYASEGIVWYDAGDDELQVYDGTNWHDVLIGSHDWFPTTDDSIDLGSAAKRLAEIHAVLVIVDALQSDDITNKAGTGPPDFSYGIDVSTVAASANPAAGHGRIVFDGTEFEFRGSAGMTQMHCNKMQLDHSVSSARYQFENGDPFFHLSAGNAYCYADILPDPDSTQDLGSATMAWALAYVDQIHAGFITNLAGTGPPVFSHGVECSNSGTSNANANSVRLTWDNTNLNVRSSAGLSNVLAGVFKGINFTDSQGSGPAKMLYGCRFPDHIPPNPPGNQAVIYFDATADQVMARKSDGTTAVVADFSP